MRKYIWALTTILSFLNGVNLRLALVGILFKSKYDKTIRGKKISYFQGIIYFEYEKYY